jgi:hypothetical protein
MIGKAGVHVNRANRELSIRQGGGSQTPNHGSAKPKRQVHRDTVDNKSDHISVYRYDGPEMDDDDVNSIDGGRNRQVSYYVNKDAMREMDNDADDDDYGYEAKKKKGYGGNIANQMHRDTYKQGGYGNRSDDEY